MTRARPELTVVIPFVNDFADLDGCLAALQREAAVVDLELLVVDRRGDPLRQRVRGAFPSVRLLDASSTTTIPTMRALGFDMATAPAVAVIEDHVIVPPGWARQMLDAVGDGNEVVAGSVENAATDTLLDWAAFLCEYSHCLPPLPAGRAEWLTGNNVVYPKTLLDRYREVTHEGRWEDYLHNTLRQDGVPLVCHPEIVVGHKKHYTFGEYLSQRYLYSRSYAGARLANAPFARRLVYGAAALGLPPVLLYRTIVRVAGKKKYRGRLAASLPLIAVFVSAWAWGEAVGYWAGPGDSLARVR